MADDLDLASPRPLTPDETSSLASSLRPHLRLHNTSCPFTAEADATDLLTYACDMVDDGQPIGDVLEELSLMEMEICDDEVLEKFLEVLGKFIRGLINGPKPKKDWRENNYLHAHRSGRQENLYAHGGQSGEGGGSRGEMVENQSRGQSRDSSEDVSQDMSSRESSPERDLRANDNLIAYLDTEAMMALSWGAGPYVAPRQQRKSKKDQRVNNRSTASPEEEKWARKGGEEEEEDEEEEEENGEKEEEEKEEEEVSEHRNLREEAKIGAQKGDSDKDRTKDRAQDMSPEEPKPKKDWRANNYLIASLEEEKKKEEEREETRAMSCGEGSVPENGEREPKKDQRASDHSTNHGGHLGGEEEEEKPKEENRKPKKDWRANNYLIARLEEEKCLRESSDDEKCLRKTSRQGAHNEGCEGGKEHHRQRHSGPQYDGGPEAEEIKTKYKRVEEEESLGNQNGREDASTNDPHYFEKVLLNSTSHVAVDLSSKSYADKGAQELQDLFGGRERRSLRDRMSMYNENGELRKEEVRKEAEEDNYLRKSGDDADCDSRSEREEIGALHKGMEEESLGYRNWREEAAGDEAETSGLDDPHCFENALLGDANHVAVDLSSKKAADKTAQELQSVFGGRGRKSLRDRMSMFDENGEIRKYVISNEAEEETYIRRSTTDPGYGWRERGEDGGRGHEQAADDCASDFGGPGRGCSNWRDEAASDRDNPHSFENALHGSIRHVAVDLSSKTAVDKKNRELRDLFGGTAIRSLQDRMRMYDKKGEIKKDVARTLRAPSDDPHGELRRQELRAVMNDRSLSKSERAVRMDEVRAKYGVAGSEVAAQHASKLSASAPPGRAPLSMLSSITSQFSADDSVSNEPAPRVGEVDLSSKAAVHNKNRELQRLFGADKADDSVSNEPAPRVGEFDLSSKAAVHKKNRELQSLFGANKANHSVSNEPAPRVGGVDLSSKAAVQKKNKELQSLFGADKKKSLKDRMAMYNERGIIIKQSSGSEEKEVDEEPKEKSVDQLRRDELMIVMNDRSLGKEERARKMEEVRQKYLASATVDVPFTRCDSNHSIASSSSDRCRDEPASPPISGAALNAKIAADKVKREMDILFERKDETKGVRGSFSRYTRQLVHNKVEMRKPMTFLNGTKSLSRQGSGKNLRNNSSGSDSSSALPTFSLKDQRRAELQQVMRDMSLTKEERQRKMEGIRKKYDSITRKRDERELMSENRNRHGECPLSSNSSSTVVPQA